MGLFLQYDGNEQLHLYKRLGHPGHRVWRRSELVAAGVSEERLCAAYIKLQEAFPGREIVGYDTFAEQLYMARP